jgi:ClpP class serine protease
MDKLGVSVDEIHFSKATKVNSILHDRHADPEALQRYRDKIDDIYETFLNEVARGRGMTVAEVRKVAGGRIFSGRVAHQVGLVDALGGIYDATQIAARIALFRQPDLLEKPTPSWSHQMWQKMPWKEPHDLLGSPENALNQSQGELTEFGNYASSPRSKLDQVPELPAQVTIETKVFPKPKSFRQLIQEQQLVDYFDYFWWGAKAYVQDQIQLYWKTQIEADVRVRVDSVDGSM